MKKIISFFLFLFITLQGFAQDPAPEMADSMRASGKIYVVVCVAAIVMGGLIIYLISIDRKVSRLEKQSGSEKK